MQNTKWAQETELYTGEYLIVTLTLWLCIEWYFHDSLCLRRLSRLHVDVQLEAPGDSRRLQPVTPPTPPSRSPSSLLETRSSPNTGDLQIPRGIRQGWRRENEKSGRSTVVLRVCVDGMWMSATRGVRNEYVLHNDYKCGHSLRASLLPRALFVEPFASRSFTCRHFIGRRVCSGIDKLLVLHSRTLSDKPTWRECVLTCGVYLTEKGCKGKKKNVILNEQRPVKEQCDLKYRFSRWGSWLNSQSQTQLCFFSCDSAAANYGIICICNNINSNYGWSGCN